MKVTTKVELNVTMKAVLREGKLTLDLSVAAPYGNDGRTAGHSHNDFSKEVEKRVKEALEAAIEEGLDEAVVGAQIAASRALLVAAERGEL